MWNHLVHILFKKKKKSFHPNYYLVILCQHCKNSPQNMAAQSCHETMKSGLFLKYCTTCTVCLSSLHPKNSLHKCPLLLTVTRPAASVVFHKPFIYFIYLFHIWPFYLPFVCFSLFSDFFVPLSLPHPLCQWSQREAGENESESLVFCWFCTMGGKAKAEER